MFELIFASNNDHKVAEIQASIGKQVNIITLRQAGIEIDIPEPHDSLEANAREKSAAIFSLTGKECFGEDTGLEVEALRGAPGVKSARYAQDQPQYSGNTEKLLSEMKEVESRDARFRTVISLKLHTGEFLFEGVCEGTITHQPKGVHGFGYDAVFIPVGSNSTFGEMSLEEKSLFSHRKKATDKMVAFLQEVLNNR
jgi:XTP/dITP diphosphohydrolase